jgi:hypothetical protein
MGTQPDTAFWQCLGWQKLLPALNRNFLCRWEKFAQEKGIQKRKRSVKVWDEEQQEWRRRFGYQRAGDDKDIPIVDAGSNDQVWRHLP